MRNKIWKYFRLAGQTATRGKDDKRCYWVGAVGIRQDGCEVLARNGPAMDRTREVHAEYRLARKLDQKAIVYIARIKVGNRKFANARPCCACRKVLKTKKVKKVYYTFSDSEFGVMYFDGTA